MTICRKRFCLTNLDTVAITAVALLGMIHAEDTPGEPEPHSSV